MISLENRFHNITKLELCNLLREQNELGNDKAKAEVTFWGSRVVTIEGFSGSVYLDDIIGKVLQQRNNNNEVDVPEVGENTFMEAVNKLRTFYAKTDNDVENSNCFTRLLVWIREFRFFNPYTARFYLDL